MILIIICIVPRVLSEVTLDHVYVPRKSRSNSEPFEIGYTNNRNRRDIYATPDSAVDKIKLNRTSSITSKFSQPTLDPYTHPKDLSSRIKLDTSAKGSLPKRDLALIEKANSKYNSRYLPSKLKSDTMYEHLKSAMHYQPPFKTKTMFGYETEYHVDDDDVRTSSRGLHDGWPYYHYNPYEYEHVRIDSEREKAKDKRYAIDVSKVIPVHEDLSHDIPHSMEPLITTTEYYFTSTDNPMSGHEPFFSFMLNDYFNKNYDYQDELTLKGIDWGKNLDASMSHREKDDFTTRIPVLPTVFDDSTYGTVDSSNKHKRNEVKSFRKGDSVTEKAVDNIHEFKKHGKGDEQKANDQTGFHRNELQRTGFKDFVDNFANRFGTEDHTKNSKYLSNRNQDKGENRKGFRRVYHKDEYQEDNEFYDNNNSSSHSEDKGSSNAHIGGSEGLLKSSAFVNLGDQASAYDKSGNTENNKFENSNSGYDKNKGYNTQFHRYRDVAKQAAQSNDADYSVH